jgi:hypothetical protein
MTIMALLPLLLLIPMTLAGLALLVHGLRALQRLRHDGAPRTVRKTAAAIGHVLALAFGAALAAESLRPLLPESTGLLPRAMLVFVAAGVALLWGHRGQRLRQAQAPAR